MAAMRRVAFLLAMLEVASALGGPAWPDVLDALEDGLGDMAARALEHNLGVWQGQDTLALVGAIASDQLPLCSRVMHCRVKILDSCRVDALALPGGYIYLYRGLLAHASSIDELAGVLAHEVAHLEDRDFRRLALRQLLWISVAGMVRGTSQGGADAILAAGVLNSLRHSRRQEAQADSMGVVIAGRASYDPSGLKAFLDRLRPRSSPWLDRVFATHPDPERRSQATEAEIQRWLASHPMAAWRVCLSLRGRGRLASALALARRCEAWPAHGYWARAESLALEAEVRRLAGVRVSLPTAGPPNRDLLARLDAIRDDRRIHQALVLAQSVGPELRDWRYWGLLSATLSELNRLGAVLDAGYETEYRLRMADRSLSTADAVAGLAAARRGGLMLAAVLGELLASGRGQPMGGLNSARAGLIWAQVRMAGAQVARGQESIGALLSAATVDLAERQLVLLGEIGRDAPNLVVPALWPVLSQRGQTSNLDQWLASRQERLRRETRTSENNSTMPLSAAAAEAAEDVYIVSRLILKQAAGEIEAARVLILPDRAEGY